MNEEWERELDSIVESLAIMGGNELIDLLLRAVRKLATILKQNPELIFQALR